MNNRTIYVLHKSGANSHYLALNHLLNTHNQELVFREFSVLSKLWKSLISLDFKLFNKQIINGFFLLSLLFSKNKKIVLGIAPYDYKLKFLLKFLKEHHIYYHTSWTCWDRSFHPKTKKNSEKIFKIWAYFLEHTVKHIFCVTEKSKQQLTDNYTIKDKQISVVYHALHPRFSEHVESHKVKGSFIYFGRIIPEKGIEEIISTLKDREDASLTLIGSGKLEQLAEKSAELHANITYFKHISVKEKLLSIIAKHQYLILNSQKTIKWEELFGLAIIESMSQGVIPIASDHSGPLEIITKNTGYLFKEGEMSETLEKILTQNETEADKALACIAFSKQFLASEIAHRWTPILK